VRHRWRTGALEDPAINVGRYPIADAGSAFNVSRWSREPIDVSECRGDCRKKDQDERKCSHNAFCGSQA
jgi:hypothetical protein